MINVSLSVSLSKSIEAGLRKAGVQDFHKQPKRPQTDKQSLEKVASLSGDTRGPAEQGHKRVSPPKTIISADPGDICRKAALPAGPGVSPERQATFSKAACSGIPFTIKIVTTRWILNSPEFGASG